MVLRVHVVRALYALKCSGAASPSSSARTAAQPHVATILLLRLNATCPIIIILSCDTVQLFGALEENNFKLDGSVDRSELERLDLHVAAVQRSSSTRSASGCPYSSRRIQSRVGLCTCQ